MLTNVLSGVQENQLQNTITTDINGRVVQPLNVAESSACCDLDATAPLSYDGTSQELKNIIVSPPVGSQTDYDFFLGEDNTATTDDPTFVGSVNSPAAYFELDGGDHFKQQTNANNTQMEFAHLTSGGNSGPTWFCCAFQYSAVSQNTVFFGNAAGATDAGTRLFMNSTNNVRFLHGAGAAPLYNQEIKAPTVWTAATPQIVLITFDSSSTGSERLWTNSATGTAWTNAFSPTASTANANQFFRIGRGVTGFPWPANSRFYHFSCGNALLDDTKAGNIITHLEARHERDYTP